MRANLTLMTKDGYPIEPIWRIWSAVGVRDL